MLPAQQDAVVVAIAFSKLILLPLLLLVTTLPIARWVRRAYDFAREDTHRVTPQSPWTFFWRRLRRPMILHGSTNLVLLILLALLSSALVVTQGWRAPAFHLLVQTTVLPCGLLSVILASLVSALCLVTRTERSTTLMVACSFFGIAIPAGLMALLAFVLPDRLHWVTHVMLDSSGFPVRSNETTLLPLYTVLILSAVFSVQVIAIRGQGREWFWKEDHTGLPRPVEAP